MKDVEIHALEADVKRELKKFLTSKGAWWFMPVPGGYSRRTIDVLVCYKGRFVGIETKKPEKRQTTPLQQKDLFDIIKANGYAIVENSTSLERTRAVFATIENTIIRDRCAAYDYNENWGSAENW